MKQERRDYSMSDAELSLKGSFIIKTAEERDLADLAVQGVDANEIDKVRVAKAAWDACPADYKLMYDMKYKTRLRDEQGVKVLQMANQTVSKPKFKWGEDDPRYLLYNLGAISQDAPAVRIIKLKKMLKTATEQKADLEDQGMTDAWLLEVSNNIMEYERLTIAQMDAVSLRRVSMIERTRLGNAFYKLLKNLADKGKLCWMYSNSAKHEDYVLYHHPTPGTQTIASIVDANDSVSHELAKIDGDTELKFTNKGLTDLTLFFDEDPMAESGSPSNVVLAGTELTVKASALGYNEAGGKINFNVFNPGAVQGSYEVQWY